MKSKLLMDQTGTAPKMQLTPDQVEMIRLRVMTDSSFRKNVLEDPTTALQSIGIQPTQALLQSIQKIDAELGNIAGILGVGERECFS